MTLVQWVSQDVKLQTYWKCSNIMAINRLGYTDHGPVHVKVAANSALKILRILIEKGVVPNIVMDYQMSNEDAEVIVVLASILHDLGMAVVRENHEEYSLLLSLEFLQRYLYSLYDEEQAVIMIAEVLHALSTHHHQKKPTTIEAGVVRVADALDMEQGRARIPFQTGKIDIHSISALAINEVKIEKGTKKPVTIRIYMSSSAGIFQVDQLLRNRIHNSGLEKYLYVIAMVTEEKEVKIIDKFEI